MDLEFWFGLGLLGFFFVFPGFSLVYGLGIHRFFDRFESMFLSIALSMLLIPSVMLISDYFGFGIGLIQTMFGLVGLMAVMTLLSKNRRQSLTLHKHPVKARILALFMMAGSTLIYLLFLQKYPIFHPNWMTGDPVVHLLYTLSILREGSASYILPYPPALHCLAAFASMLTGIDPIFTVRYMAAFAGVILPVYVYIASSEILRDWRTGLASAFFLSFFFPLAMGHFGGSGTWANILVEPLTLAFLLMFFRMLRASSLAFYGLTAYTIAALTLVHREPVAVAGFLMIFMVGCWIKLKDKRKIFTAAMLTLIFGLSASSMYLVSTLLEFSSLFMGQNWMALAQITVPSLESFPYKLYEASPFLYYAWGVLNVPFGPFLTAVGCALAFRRKLFGDMFTVFWFLSILGLSFAAWRFGFFDPYRLLIFSLIPASMVGGILFKDGVFRLADRISRLTDISQINIANKYLFISLIVVCLLNVSYTIPYTYSLISSDPYPPPKDIDTAVYGSFRWLEDNLSKDREVSLASLEIPLYAHYRRYLEASIGIKYVGDFSIPLEKMLKIAGERKVNYLAVYKLSFYAKEFESSSYLTKIYENNYITIYEIKKCFFI